MPVFLVFKLRPKSTDKEKKAILVLLKKMCFCDMNLYFTIT